MSINKTAAKFNSKPIIIIAAILAVICLCLCTIALIIGIIYLSKDTGPTITPNAQGPTITPNAQGPTITPNAQDTTITPIAQGPTITPNAQDTTITPTTPVTQDLPESNPQTQTWLVMVYLDADNNIEEDLYFDLNEIEMVGSNDRVKMVAQIDRSAEYFAGDGDWTIARRYYLTQDSDLNTINSKMIADLGEVDMGNSNTLVDFATWAIQSYPADKYVLILSDHGSGWPGGWTDDSPQDPYGNYIYLSNLESALGQTIANTGIRQFELVGLDACLMSMLEVYNGLAPYAHYAVASEETEPGLGWAYTSFLGDLAAHPEMSGADLGKAIVEGYIIEDQRLLNDDARTRMLSGVGYYEPKSASELAQEWGTTITLTAVDLSTLPQLNVSLDNFLYTLKNVDQTKVAEARSYAQAFYNVFDDSYPSPYIDLSNFADSVVTTTGDQGVSQATLDLQTSLSAAIVAEKHGDQRPGARGIAVYFPVSEIYWNEDNGVTFYTDETRTSASQNLWDDFLAFHYTGQEFGLGNPSKEARIPAPGSSQVTISPLTINPTTISSNGLVNIQTDISGDHIAYIYILSLIKHSSENRYLAYNIDILMTDKSQEQNGVVYPVYERSNGSIHLNIDYKINGNGVCDATDTCYYALVNPDKYTTQPENLLYYVEGWYIYSKTGEKIPATMYFNNYGDNLIRNIIANPVGNNSIAVPNELVPTSGDQFLTMNTEWAIDSSGIVNTTYHEGNTLTFGDQPFHWGYFGTTDPGKYALGLMVIDMDGSKTFLLAPVTVK